MFYVNNEIMCNRIYFNVDKNVKMFGYYLLVRILDNFIFDLDKFWNCWFVLKRIIIEKDSSLELGKFNIKFYLRYYSIYIFYLRWFKIILF